MKPFIVTVAAKADLTEIALFTQHRWGEDQRNLYLKQVDAAFWLLAKNPETGKSADEIREGYRKFPVGSHIIFYQPIANNYQIKIIRILHKSMDVNPMFNV
jgi:toxin ParE1/3/4